MHKKIWSNLWIVSFAAIAFCMIMRGTPNGDTFFLAATGKFIVENGYVPTTNPFVIHEHFRMIVQQWLFDVMTYGIYGNFGNVGLVIFECVMCVVTMFLLNQYMRMFTDNDFIRKTLLYIFGCFYLPFLAARPTITTFPTFLLLLILAESYRRSQKVKYLIPLPFLALLQINMHSSMWPMMFVMLMPYVFPVIFFAKGKMKYKLQSWFGGNKYLLLAMLLMLLAGFLNPNGLDGMLYVIKSYGSATDGLDIIELQPPAINDSKGLLIMLCVGIFAIYVYKIKGKYAAKEWSLQEIFARTSMFLGVLFLMCMHQRNLWYLLLGAAPMVLITLTDLKLKIFEKKDNLNYYQWLRRLALGIGVTFIVCMLMFSMADFSKKTSQDSSHAPMAAADYLDQISEEEEISLYTEFNNGAYMEWRGYKVYMDARPELFQKNINDQEDVWSEYITVQNGTVDFEAFLLKYEFTHLIVTDHSWLDMHLKLSPNYKVAVDGNGYSLYEKT